MYARMLVRLLYSIALSSICVLPGLAQAQDGSSQVSEDPSGTVTMNFGRGVLLISATGGHGVLTFQGQTHNFKLGGMGFGFLGFSKVEAVGEVYHLTKLEDFPGAYVQGSVDYAAGEGQGMLWLRNTKGVVLKLRSKTTGVSLAASGEGLAIQMGDIKK